VRPDEQGSATTQVATSDPPDVERMLIDSMGAEVIIDHSSEEPGKG
jgi:hypothetical protein